MANVRPGLPWYTLIVGLAIVIAFGAMCSFMLDKANTTAPSWDHYMLVFNAVQALAAAAVGALLGTTVQQSKVDVANARTDAAETKAQSNQADADKTKQVRNLMTTLQPPGAGPNDRLAAINEILRS